MKTKNKILVTTAVFVLGLAFMPFAVNFSMAATSSATVIVPAGPGNEPPASNGVGANGWQQTLMNQSVTPTLPAGCASSAGRSTITGLPCSSANPAAQPSTPTTSGQNTAPTSGQPGQPAGIAQNPAGNAQGQPGTQPTGPAMQPTQPATPGQGGTPANATPTAAAPGSPSFLNWVVVLGTILVGLGIAVVALAFYRMGLAARIKDGSGEDKGPGPGQGPGQNINS